MKYRGYEALVSFDEDDRVLCGRVLSTRDVISFEAESVDGIERAFHEAVDDYLEQCAEARRDPDRSFSGKLLVRMHPDLHREVYLEAARSGASLNAWITESLESRVAGSRGRSASVASRRSPSASFGPDEAHRAVRPDDAGMIRRD